MAPEKIIEQLRQRPFRPFRIHLSDGAAYEVMHPELAVVTRRQITIAFRDPHRPVPDRSVICAPMHVTRLEILDDAA